MHFGDLSTQKQHKNVGEIDPWRREGGGEPGGGNLCNKNERII